MPSGAQTPDGITFSCSNLFKTLSPIFSFTMGLTGHTPESLNRHPNIPTTVPASSHDYAFLVPFVPPGFKLRRQGNLTSGGFLDGAHWAYTDNENLYIGCRIENDDIWTLDRRDQQRHYLTGDVFEVFLKPEESNAYLELYATPSGNKSALQTGADRSQTGSAGGSLRAGGQKAGQVGVVRTYRQAEFLNISMRCFRPGGRESPASTAAGNPHC